MDPAEPDLLDRLVLLTHGLQGAGFPSGPSEAVDAAEALRHVALVDRTALREALRATLVKRPDNTGSFNLLFDQYFSTRSLRRAGPVGPAETPGTSTPASALVDQILDAVINDELAALAARLVTRYSGIGEHPGTERYHVQRVLRAADLSRVVADAGRILRSRLDHSDALAARLMSGEQAAKLDDLRRLIADEVRLRLALVGDVAVIRRSTRIDELQVMMASTTELRALREAVRPLARKLASRMAQRRRQKSRGKLDVRRTVRRSLQTGGVPLQPALRERRASKPDVVVLCDVSGSVAEFANFTLQLLTALHGELALLRSFVFVDGICEVTDLLETSEHAVDPRFLISRPGVVVGDGHSDYARVFEGFARSHLASIRSSTTLSRPTAPTRVESCGAGRSLRP